MFSVSAVGLGVVAMAVTQPLWAFIVPRGASVSVMLAVL